MRPFDLEVSWREPVPDEAPFDISWDALAQAGVAPEISMLHKGALRLSVTEAPLGASGHGPIEHIGVQVSVDQMAKVRDRVRALDLQIVAERTGELLDFIDSYGVEWELDSRSFSNPRSIVEQKRARAKSH